MDFQPKDVVWMLVGVALGGVVGWFISLWFYRRQKRDTAEEMVRGGEAEAGNARRVAQRVAERLWEAAQAQSEDGVEAARRELEAGRRILITTNQESLVDEADDAIDATLEWFDAGPPLPGRGQLDEQIRRLYVNAGGDPVVLVALLQP